MTDDQKKRVGISDDHIAASRIAHQLEADHGIWAHQYALKVLAETEKEGREDEIRVWRSVCAELAQEAFQNDPWHLLLYARKAVEIRVEY